MRQKIYHLEVEEDLVEEYWMAVHSPVEAHQIAFYINQHSSILLKRSQKDLENLRKEGPFQLFEWEDLYTDTKCLLLSNKTIEQKSSPLSKMTLYLIFPKEMKYLYLLILNTLIFL